MPKRRMNCDAFFIYDESLFLYIMHMKMRTLLLLSLALLACTGKTQIVNIENSRIHYDSVGWVGTISANVSFTQNTDKIFDGGLDVHLQMKTKDKKKGLWIVLGNVDELKINKSSFISNDMAHIRYDHNVNPWLIWEAFGQYQRNVITQIDARYLVGTGPRFKLVNQKLIHVFTGIIFMYEHEKDITVPVIQTDDIRNSDYISFVWTPRSFLEFSGTTYYQPLPKNFSDFRFLNQLTFIVKATPHFSMNLKWNYLYDSYPAGTAPNRIYSFSTGLRYEFL